VILQHVCKISWEAKFETLKIVVWLYSQCWMCCRWFYPSRLQSCGMSLHSL